MNIRSGSYGRTLLSGYGLIGVQILFALATVPLALNYLGKELFGVWALAVQASVWLQLVDTGMNGAVARFLIDYRDEARAQERRQCIATGFRILSLQGLGILVLSIALGRVSEVAFNLSKSDADEFEFVLFVLGAASCLGFTGKIHQAWLYGCQRLDLVNGVGLAVTLVEWGMLVWFLKSGWGLHSLAWARLLSTVLALAAFWWVSIRVAGFPVEDLRGSWSRPMFRRLIAFGGGMFLLTLGTQLLTMTQTAIVARNMGLSIAAVWATAPKIYQLILQVVAKLWDYRVPFLSRLMAEEDLSGLRRDFSGVFRSTALVGGSCLGAAIAINSNFLNIWTSGKIAWSQLNDVLMALSIYLSLLVRCVTDFILHTKKVGWMPALMLVEGMIFVVVASVLSPRLGLLGMLLSSLVICGSLRLPYAWPKLREYVGMTPRESFGFLKIAAMGIGCGMFAYFPLHWLGGSFLGGRTYFIMMVQAATGGALIILMLWFLLLNSSSRSRYGCIVMQKLSIGRKE